MSTKTTIKRIALVAAVAAAFGGLSTVAANASATATFAATTGTAFTNTGTAAASVSATTSTYVAATITFTGVTSNAVNLVSTGVGTVYIPSIAAGTNNVATTNITTLSATVFEADTTTSVPGSSSHSLGATGSVGTPVGTLAISAYSSVAGSQVITVDGSTLTITWGALPTVSVGYSTAYLGSSTATSWASDATVVVSKSAVAGSIKVTALGSDDLAFYGSTVSATVSGPGLVSISQSQPSNPNTTTGTAKVASLTMLGTSPGNNAAYVDISGDSTAGTSTITVSLTDPNTGVSTVLATKTVTFTGSAATASAVGNLKVLQAGGSTYSGTDTASGALIIGLGHNGNNGSTTGTVALTGIVKDSNGNQTNASGTHVRIVSSDSTVLSAGSCAAATSTTVQSGYDVAATAGIGEYNCVVNGTSFAASGKSATITFQASTDSGSTFSIVATPVTFTIGGSIASTVLSTDSTSYVPLTPVTVTTTSKDSAGNAAYDQDVTTVASITPSIQLGGSLASPTKIIAGVGTSTGAYAPAAAYPTVTISGKDSTSAGNAISTSFTVTGGASTDAANTATDAANQATDAANNAIDAANAAADTAQTAADAAQSAADTATQALAAAQDANQNATDALAAAQEATDAGNAATDAANAAADSADAATAAAQDASDKAAAALAAVTQLSAQFTTLAAQVAKVLTAVQAIAKATTPAKKK